VQLAHCTRLELCTVKGSDSSCEKSSIPHWRCGTQTFKYTQSEISPHRHTAHHRNPFLETKQIPSFHSRSLYLHFSGVNCFKTSPIYCPTHCSPCNAFSVWSYCCFMSLYFRERARHFASVSRWCLRVDVSAARACWRSVSWVVDMLW